MSIFVKSGSVRAPKIFGTGLLSLDLLIAPHEDYPSDYFTGGTCGNVLTILSYFGWEAFPVARLNGDIASKMVRKDLRKWEVKLRYASLEPSSQTPIIVQKNVHQKNGISKHRFSWDCPNCGNWLPGYKPVTNNAIDNLGDDIKESRVFFFDRVSRSALTLAKQAYDSGALVVFEPSQKGDPKLLEEAFNLCHILKYSNQRFPDRIDAISQYSNIQLELRTCGEEGLEYRTRFENYKSRQWRHMKAFHVENVVDTAGSGDWFTSGLISQLGRNGTKKIKTVTKDDFDKILVNCQALSAWNCLFSGARGGMYSTSQDEFKHHIKNLVLGKKTNIKIKKKHIKTTLDTICPSC